MAGLPALTNLNPALKQEINPSQVAQAQSQVRNLETRSQIGPTRSKLTDEERARNKRERNRKAAADCRRRKDEKLKALAKENDELRMTIESLQAELASLKGSMKNE